MAGFDEKIIEVFRRSEAWAKDQYVYARIEFSKPVTVNKNEKGNKALFGFAVKKGEVVSVKVAISSVDYDGAKKNMEAALEAKVKALVDARSGETAKDRVA